MRKITLLYLLCGALHVSAGVLNVPSGYPTIQSAINASVNGDTVVVQPGTYLENINYRGKRILLTSLYYLAGDTAYIRNTVINGSAPQYPDTASCVIFNSGEDSTAVLQGFLITGGGGTRWSDEHGAGDYREGGGILIALSSPTIRHNIIWNNACVNMTGVNSTGGGGLRIGDGNPRVLNNVIAFNYARYGPGLVLNYTGCTVRNNIIAYNWGGSAYFGGGALWINNNNAALPKLIENNTIYGNKATVSNGTGGVLAWSANNVKLRNNIIWNNKAPLAAQVKNVSCTMTVDYSDVQGGWTGTGNSNVLPQFTDTFCFYLDTINLSPCSDAGDTAAAFQDVENTSSPGNALFPATGSLRNDMGAYGGQGGALLSCVGVAPLGTGPDEQPAPVQLYVNGDLSELTCIMEKEAIAGIAVYDLTGRKVVEIFQGNLSEGLHRVPFPGGSLSSGLYLIRLETAGAGITLKASKN